MEGIYEFGHPGGAFEVHCRPHGKFFAPKFQAKSAWLLHEGKLQVDFGKFGQYEFVQQEPGAWKGGAVGNPENWRTMKFVRPFSAAEIKLLGSRWSLIHPGGEFEVEFHADAFNHFVCHSFPAHSHWTMSGNNVHVSWGKYGEYDLVIDETGDNMTGSATGAPDNWRKARYIAPLDAGAVSGHEHSH